MTATETILFGTIWGLLIGGLYFALRSIRRKRRQHQPDQKP
ncbi:hypothetical protein JCM30471_16020 [Desulfuromonas carbonis]|nr:hypothetical protein [Desulfuromonas sp. DDH964]AMV73193.1 hypothetical protein DBW_2884 [Desulfuromonas sp. DDH964]